MRLIASGDGVTPAVPANFTTEAAQSATPFLGTRLLVNAHTGSPTLSDDQVYTVTAQQGAVWTLTPAPTGLVGGEHVWCVLETVNSLDVLGNAQFTHNGCLRVAGNNRHDSDTTWAIAGGVHVDTLEVGATELAFTGPNGRFDVRRPIAVNTEPYGFHVVVDGALTASTDSLRLGTLAEVTASTLQTRDLSVDSSVSWQGPVTSQAVSIAGDATFGGIVKATSLNITGDAAFGGALTTTQASEIGGDATFDGQVTSTVMDIGGSATFGAQVTSTVMDIGGDATFMGPVVAREIATVGTAVFHDNVNLDGHYEGLSADVLRFTGASAVVRHDAHSANTTDRRKAILTGRVVEFLDGARVDAAGRGFPAEQGPLVTLRAGDYAGGSHLGRGYSGPPSFDNIYRPELGGGGGGGDSSCSGCGGRGGGVAHVVATERATVGAIDASGYAYSQGGGAGGSIYVEAPLVELNGVLNVRGGAGLNSGGGGGGGSVAIVTNALSGALGGGSRRAMVDLRGGAASNGGRAAGAGTFYLAEGPGPGDLLVDNGDQPNTPRDSTPLPFQFYGVPTAVTATGFTVSPTPAHPAVGYHVAPHALQLTPALSDNTVFAVTANPASSGVLTLDGDPSALTAPGQVGCAYYRFKHLDIVGNAQLFANGCLRVDQGNHGTSGLTYSVNGALHADLADMNNVQSIVVSGPQGRFDVGTQVGAATLDYPFHFTLSGTFTSTGFVGEDLTATDANMSVTGPISLSGTLNVSGTTLSAKQVTVGESATFTGGSVTATGLSAAQDLTATNTTLTLHNDLSAGETLLVSGTTLSAKQVSAGESATFTGGSALVDGIQARDDLTFENNHQVETRGLGDGLVSTEGSVLFRDAGTSGTHTRHSAAFNNELGELSIVAAVDVAVTDGATLDVIAKGYYPTYAPTAALRSSGTAGGSHAGLGGGSGRGKPYDLLYAPVYPGGGGAAGFGGGVVLVTAGGDVTLDSVLANGGGGEAPAVRCAWMRAPRSRLGLSRRRAGRVTATTTEAVEDTSSCRR